MLLSQRFSRLDVVLDGGTHDVPRSAMPMRRVAKTATHFTCSFHHTNGSYLISVAESSSGQDDFYSTTLRRPMPASAGY